jgi:CHRD domain-containing protein
MFQSRRLSTVFAVLVTSLFAAPVFAHGKSTFPTTLSGYNETAVTVNSAGSGSFVAKVSKDELSISYTLTYSDLPSNALQAHIHFGRPSLSGGVALFLCTNLTPPVGVPVPPPCPVTAGTVTGTLTAADVIALPAQSIDAGAAGFAEMIKALRNGAAYANVHTVGHPSGEIRGPLGIGDDDEGDDD